MPQVELSENNIYTRGTQLRSLVQDIAGPGGPHYENISSQNSLVIVLFDGERGTHNVSDLRFRTCYRGFRVNYYELWKAADQKQSIFYLEKAYLTLYRLNEPFHQNEEKEYLCFHCDLGESDEENASSVYAKCPHLHIKVAPDPIPKSHIGLAAQFSDLIFENAASLTDTIKVTIDMIKSEILENIDKQ